jgi:hypothetical protein
LEEVQENIAVSESFKELETTLERVSRQISFTDNEQILLHAIRGLTSLLKHTNQRTDLTQKTLLQTLNIVRGM